MSFERDVFIDKPGIVGARWWHKSLIAEDAKMRRRAALKTIAMVGGIAGSIGLVGYAIAKASEGSANTGSSGEEVKLQTRASLDMQRKYGWDFGARGEALVFDGKTTAPFDRSFLATLAGVMRSASYAQLGVGTLLESLSAVPTDTLPKPPDGSPAADSAPFQKLADVLVPVQTAEMRRAYRAGLALARLAKNKAKKVALLVDLPGPESVAFAAGACEVFEPVLLFDNWPHPRGVVPSHMTLAALAYYQPRFTLQNNARKHSSAAPPPMFLLDRLRTNPYSEEWAVFDNRYYAKPPPIDALVSRGFDKILYVVESSAVLPEVYERTDLDMLGTPEPATARAIALTDFSVTSSDEEPSYYGGTAMTDASIWVNYPFVDGYTLPAGSTVATSDTSRYRFQPHKTMSLAMPALGTTAVVVTASGLLVAAALDRRGSMNRFAGGWGG